MTKAKKISRKRLLKITLSILIALIVLSGLSTGVYAGINYLQAKNLIREAENLLLIDKLDEGLEKYALADSKWISNKLKVEIELNMKGVGGAINDKYNYEKGAEYFDEGKYQEAKEELEKVRDFSRYFSDAQALLLKVNAKLTATNRTPQIKTAATTPKPTTTTPTPSPSPTKLYIPNAPQVIQQKPFDPYENSPRDSQGVLCISSNSRCKYECSVADHWIDDYYRILNNHIWEYQLSVKIYGPDSNNAKIWENAVMSVYNKMYDYCINSPIFHPNNPL